LALWKSIPEMSVLLVIPFHKTRLPCRLRVPRQTPAEASDGNELEAFDGIAVTVVVTVVTVVLLLNADPVSSLQSMLLVSGIPRWRIRCHQGFTKGDWTKLSERSIRVDTPSKHTQGPTEQGGGRGYNRR
jgi:hypothetical protein